MHMKPSKNLIEESQIYVFIYINVYIYINMKTIPELEKHMYPNTGSTGLEG